MLLFLLNYHPPPPDFYCPPMSDSARPSPPLRHWPFVKDPRIPVQFTINAYLFLYHVSTNLSVKIVYTIFYKK